MLEILEAVGESKLAVPALVETMIADSQDPFWRNGDLAASTLIRLGETQTLLPGLITTLKSGPRLRQLTAAKFLAKIGPKASASREALLDVYFQTGNAIVAHRGDPVTGLVKYAAKEALLRLGPEAKPIVPRLIEALEKGEVRGNQPLQVVFDKEVVQFLGQLGPLAAPAVPAMTEALKTKPHLRREVISALGYIGPEARTAIPSLTEFLKDSQLGFETATTLMRIGESKASVGKHCVDLA